MVLRLEGDLWWNGGRFHLEVVHQAKTERRVVGNRRIEIVVANKNIAAGEHRVGNGADGQPVYGPRHRVADLRDDDLPPAKAEGSNGQTAGLLWVGALLPGGCRLVAGKRTCVVRVPIAGRVGIGACRINARRRGLQGGAGQGGEIRKTGRRVAAATFAVGRKPHPVRAAACAQPLDSVSIRANSGSEVFGRTDPSAGKRAIDIHPQIKAQPVVAHQRQALRRDAERGRHTPGHVGFHFDSKGGAS